MTVDSERGSVMENDLILRVDEEPDGEGWFDCRVCGVWAGFENKAEAMKEAERHDTTDCAEELAYS